MNGSAYVWYAGPPVFTGVDFTAVVTVSFTDHLVQLKQSIWSVCLYAKRITI